MRLTTRLVLALGMSVGAAVPAFAHAIKATVTVTPTKIQVQVRFDGEDDLRGKVTVKLLDAAGTVIGQAEPDKEGNCAFPRPEPGGYKIVAEDDGFGHRAEKRFEVPDGTTETVTHAEPDRPRGLMIAIGIGAIGVFTLVGYWLAGRKKAVN